MIHILQLSRISADVAPLKIQSALGLKSRGQREFGWQSASTPPGRSPEIRLWTREDLKLETANLGGNYSGRSKPEILQTDGEVSAPALTGAGNGTISLHGSLTMARSMGFLAGRIASRETAQPGDIFAALVEDHFIPGPGAVVHRVDLPEGEFYPDLVLDHGLEEISADLNSHRQDRDQGRDQGTEAFGGSAGPKKIRREEVLGEKMFRNEEQNLFLEEFYRCFIPFCSPHQLHTLFLNPLAEKRQLYPSLHRFVTYLANMSDLAGNSSGEA
ncbi:hypothetical protein [Salinispira pacifica]|uniref:Uncharacterized protein n=1 Tax=Salinispira pacifica TaxID=1307761 RepID=V5WL92_9SPIO|nr:hypothetical protein [Salinispira pacifica]AHC15971.1 hypothetical protein L21SP2_2619 [Salinispira pacifica]